MNNKGFTLIELLAVIVILISVSLVAVASISSTLQKREGKECQEQIEIAKNAAKIYFSLNDTTTVTIEELKNNKFINENSKTDRLQDNDYISFTNSGYSYTGNGECTE